MRYRISLAGCAALLLASFSAAQPNDVSSSGSDYFDTNGMKVRLNVPLTTPNGDNLLFQAINTCRLVDTRQGSKLDPPYGGPAFRTTETRTYSLPAASYGADGSVTNPCTFTSRRTADIDAAPFPTTIVALALEVTVINRTDAAPTAGVLTVGTPDPSTNVGGLSLWFGWYGPNVPISHQVCVKTVNGQFPLSLTSDLSGLTNESDVVVDVLGYMVNDPQKGEAGPQGPAGLQGLKGDTGPQGIQGLAGPTGPTGPQGLKGDAGAQGIQGLTGPTGPVGPQGFKGDIGPQGIQGSAGPTGPSGPQGLKGDTGLRGIQGPTGPTGPSGPQGLKGDTGLQGIQGTTGPTGPQGFKGDIGPQGAQGLAGPTGPTGPQGLKGATGPQGLSGPTGAQGPAGLMGPVGPSGPSGPTGPKGDKGDPGSSAIPVMQAGSQDMRCGQGADPGDKGIKSQGGNCVATVSVPGLTGSCQVSAFYMNGSGFAIEAKPNNNGTFTASGPIGAPFAWVTLCSAN